MLTGNMACSQQCKLYGVFFSGTFLLLCGVLGVLCWSTVTDYIYRTQLSLSETSKGFDMWKETPIPIYLDVYFFNWTNPEKTQLGEKPKFVEKGPYSFSEKHTRVNITWNPENNTLTYRQIREWHFVPSRSVGQLDDEIVTLNAIAVTIADKVKNFNSFLKKLISLAIGTEESIWVRRTVRELLFDGYKDPFIDIALKIQKYTNISLPFDKFGYFYSRNMSSTYDGTYNLYTGQNNFSNLGYIYSWNDYTHTPYYEGHCGDVVGTTGELLPPLVGVNRLPVFASDLCSTVSLTRSSKTVQKHGIDGVRFYGEAREFDNGTLYPEFKCFSPVGGVMPSGIRDVKKCRYGAPAYVSFPHFYLADPSYVEAVDGLHPSKEHEFYLDVQETTGLPLEVRAQLQINMLIEPVKDIKMFEKVPKVVMPIFYFRQTVSLTPDLASQVQLLLNLPSLGHYIFYGFSVVAVCLLVLSLYMACRKKDDDESLLCVDDEASHQGESSEE